ncbi:hypothetical protein SO694_0000319 [Aureococcus anophagefferens]|uniref:Uncharacterized protein n=1 Tax=Aureococcus anophagefferens TaxID=44056 RepID=A0ABR1GDJ9_AURAN
MSYKDLSSHLSSVIMHLTCSWLCSQRSSQHLCAR